MAPRSEARAVLEDLASGRRGTAQPAGDPDLPSALSSHGLGGLALSAIARGEWAAPAALTEALQVDHASARRWTVVLDLELERIARARECAEPGPAVSPPIVLKGPAVARRYREPSARPYQDIDLLVPAQELDAWITILNGVGYRVPTAWTLRWARDYHHEVKLRRTMGERDIICELHTCLWVERRARRVDYATLASACEPSPWPGVLWPRADALLVVLALHLLHHRPEDRRLIWVRDFIELGNTRTVAGARALARGWEVDWALEEALREVEKVLGSARWQASPPANSRFGLASIAGMSGRGHLYHFAMMRELGIPGSLKYLATLLDPRRFATSERRFDRRELSAWARRVSRTAVATPWFRGTSRRRS